MRNNLQQRKDNQTNEIMSGAGTECCQLMETYSDSITLEWDVDDRIWIGYASALPGCSAHGKTREEALYEIKEAIACYLDAELEEKPRGSWKNIP